MNNIEFGELYRCAKSIVILNAAEKLLTKIDHEDYMALYSNLPAGAIILPIRHMKLMWLNQIECLVVDKLVYIDPEYFDQEIEKA
jgi:hypothetical protein